jgi:hypothetical protein
VTLCILQAVAKPSARRPCFNFVNQSQGCLIKQSKSAKPVRSKARSKQGLSEASSPSALPTPPPRSFLWPKIGGT